MGIESELPAVPSLTLGTADVTPIEMASAYQTLANDGKHCEPYTVAKVRRRRRRPVPTQAGLQAGRSPEIAHLVTAMLQGVVSGGTGTAAALGRGRSRARPGRRRTTRTRGSSDTRGRSRRRCGWVSPERRTRCRSYFGGSVFGGTLAAPIWHDYMLRVMAGMPAESFPAPPPPQSGRCPTWSGSSPSTHRTCSRRRTSRRSSRSSTPPIRRARSSHRPGGRHVAPSWEHSSRSRSAAASPEGEGARRRGHVSDRREGGARGGRVRRGCRRRST